MNRLALLGCCLFVASVNADVIRQSQTSGPLEVLLESEVDRCSLSDSFRLKLKITGPAPLRVSQAKEWLAVKVRPFWRIRPEGAVRLTMLDPNRECWEQSFRVDPYLVGEQVPLQLDEITVRFGNATQDQKIDWKQPILIRVTTQITDPRLTKLRPATEVEELPVDSVPTSTDQRWLWGLAGLLLLIILALSWWRPRARTSPIETNSPEWTLAELDQLEIEPLPNSEWFHRLTELLKGHLGWRTQQSLRHRTTPEVMQVLKGIVTFEATMMNEMQTRFEQLDASRFGPDGSVSIATASRVEWIRWARAFVDSGKLGAI